MPLLRLSSRLAFLVLVGTAVAQEEPAPPRYAWKTGDKHWFEIEKSFDPVKTTELSDVLGKSTLRFVVELTIGKKKPKEEAFEATYTVRRITSETMSPSTGEKLTFDSDKGDPDGYLAKSGYPQVLAKAIGDPFKCTIDARGGIHNPKPPKVARDEKSVASILGSSTQAGLFGLCVPELPADDTPKHAAKDEAKDAAKGASWPSKVDMSISKDEPVEFEVSNTLVAKDDGSAVVEQVFAPKKDDAAKLELLEGKGTGGCAKDGAMLERRLDLSIQGSISMAGAPVEGKMAVRVATTAAWTQPKKGKKK